MVRAVAVTEDRSHSGGCKRVGACMCTSPASERVLVQRRRESINEQNRKKRLTVAWTSVNDLFCGGGRPCRRKIIAGRPKEGTDTWRYSHPRWTTSSRGNRIPRRQVRRYLQGAQRGMMMTEKSRGAGWPTQKVDDYCKVWRQRIKRLGRCSRRGK